MREGLDQDDIYIMVEDEFHAISKTFTQHLHHAEYLRLKSLAKSQNASTISNISRPTDSITAMRKETKIRKEAEARASKQKNALQQMQAQTATRRPQTASDMEESDEEDSKYDDPWVGTTLQGLMMSPSRGKTSLTGLQRVHANTRAAAGYSKAERSSPKGARPIDLMERSALRTDKTPEPSEEEDDAATEDGGDDDDDLDAPARQRRLAPKKHIETPTKAAAEEVFRRAMGNYPPQRDKNTHFDDLPLPQLSPANRSSTKGILKPTIPLTDLDIFGAFPQPAALGRDAASRRMKRIALLKAKEAEVKRRAGSVNEIPMFLA